MKKIFLIIALTLCFLTFVLRIPMFFSPFDGAYEYLLAFIGRQVFRGGGFYSSPWSMKPPGEPLTYGILYLLAGVKNWELAVRLFCAVLGSSTTLIIFLLGRIVFNPVVGIFAALFWSVFSSGGTFAGTSAYAEMFMPFFTLVGIYLYFLFKKENRKKGWFFFSGLALGISLLYKQSAIFDFLPFLLYVFWENFSSMGKISLKKTKALFFRIFPVAFGYVLPLALFILYFFLIGKFSLFFDWVIYKPFLYGKLRTNPGSYFHWMWKDAYVVWGLALMGILLAFVKRKKETIFLIFWIMGCLGTLFSSGKYWNYYFLQLFIPACLLASVAIYELIIFEKKCLPKEFYLLKNVLISVLVIGVTFSLNSVYFKKIFDRFFPFFRGEITRKEYRALLSDEKEKERFATAEYLKTILKKKDNVFVWDGGQALYVLADIMPIYNDYVWNQQFWYQKNDWIGFIFSPSFENVETSRRGLMEKLKGNPPDYIVIAVDPVKEIFLRIKEFPDFFSLVFTNYEMIKTYDDVWVYKLKVAKDKIVVPKKLAIDPNFTSNYLAYSKRGNLLVIEPLSGEPGEIEAAFPAGAKLILKEVPISLSFFGLDNRDYVGGVIEKPSGVIDLHMKLKGVDRPIKMISIKKENDLWVYPFNELNYVIKMARGENELDLFFEPPENKNGEYRIFIIYQDNSFSKL